MTQRQLTDTLGNSSLQNLTVLQLDYCGQCSFDDQTKPNVPSKISLDYCGQCSFDDQRNNAHLMTLYLIP
ncbi:hypothetical protein L1987_54634 [Smallanthus sonchifolius]|uniref:Uncharacterized protein n=1 Tax=Smallanthus sonchifolius TaxID=185202 RepID=A0ACB9E8C4_9ASTR|nr:hypothetical protein L1987_54634 [Smallanthus sonchifolius]